MFDIITFGSATIDTFLRLENKDYCILKKNKFATEKAFCMPLGAKLSIKDLKIFSGGGGTNTACTFSKQGFKVSYVGKVGNDKNGEQLVEELKKFKVGTEFIKKDKKQSTAFSIILSSSTGERTALVYRGACHFMKKDDVPWNKIKKTKWFYLAPLSEKSAKLFGPLVNFAKKNNIKVAANLGNSQINLNRKILNPILSNLDVLILNKEEASLLAKISDKNEKKIMKKLCLLCKGIVVITKGKQGSMVSDGKYIFEAGIPPVLAKEATGAGDAYGSGFLSGLLKKNSIEYAIELATANSTNCTQKIGAKNGLLQKNKWGSWPKIKVNKKLL